MLKNLSKDKEERFKKSLLEKETIIDGEKTTTDRRILRYKINKILYKQYKILFIL